MAYRQPWYNMADLPKVTINLTVSTGSIHETANETGLASLTGEMIKQGSADNGF